MKGPVCLARNEFTTAVLQFRQCCRNLSCEASANTGPARDEEAGERVVGQALSRGAQAAIFAPYGAVSDDPAAYSRGSRFHPDNAFFHKAFSQTSPAEMAKRRRTGPSYCLSHQAYPRSLKRHIPTSR
jgi:hypothetical protein